MLKSKQERPAKPLPPTGIPDFSNHDPDEDLYLFKGLILAVPLGILIWYSAAKTLIYLYCLFS